jgi:hypothetical protein
LEGAAAAMNRIRRDRDTLSAVLYRVDGPFWQTDVSVSGRLKVTFCSGYTKREWYTHVDPEHAGRLHESLGEEANRNDTLSAESLLLRILERFQSDSKNPYEQILHHLEVNNIPYKSEVW